MLVSEKWLREWINPPHDLAKIAYDLTQAGLEVEKTISPDTEHLQHIKVAEVLETSPHPNADRLKLCRVTDGSKEYSIVCGAANVRPGIKVALAVPGTKLPGGIKIKESKIRGTASAGMLCSSKELGLSDEHEGIMEMDIYAQLGDVQLGSSIEKYVTVADAQLDISITPNRGDCLSIMGVAREVAAINSLQINPLDSEQLPVSGKDELPIELLSPQDCPRYLGRIIKGVDLSRPTPNWMQQKLRDSGLNPINIAVDITNYVMQELGQPLHAFDLTRIKGGIKVRRAKSAEKLTLLDGTVLTLAEDDLLIADHEKPLALAGVMGGKDSAIADNTADVFLEGAFFTPESVFGKQQKYNLVTEAAHRFERGVDPHLPRLAIERATKLLVDAAGGSPCPITEALSDEHLPKALELELAQEWTCSFLGFEIKESQIEKILVSLGMEIISKQNDNGKGAVWQIRIPSHRSDIDCPAALCEELARIYGYDKIPLTLPSGALQPRLTGEYTLREDEIRELLAARGFNEIITYSFVSEKEIALIDPNISPLKLVNPISSDMAVMRNSLLPGMLSTLAHNQRHQSGHVENQKLFEMGLCFVPHQDNNNKLSYMQQSYIGMVIAQPQGSSRWGESAYDLSSLVADINCLISLWGAEQGVSVAYPWQQSPGNTAKNKSLSTSPGTSPSTSPSISKAKSKKTPDSIFHPRQFVRIVKSSKPSAESANKNTTNIGMAGLLHPQIAAAYKLKKTDVYFLEVRLDALEERGSTDYVRFSRQPYARRELALVLDENTSFGLLQEYIQNALDKNLRQIDLLDIYTSSELGAGKKSLALRLTWQADDATLTDEYLNSSVDKLLQQLQTKHGITLRV